MRIARWVVLAEGHRMRWGGDLRRAWIFRALAERTRATLVDGWSERIVRAQVPGRRWPLGAKPRLASVEFLAPAALAVVRERSQPAALDVHDDPRLQATALGVEQTDEAAAAARERLPANTGAFRWLVTPSLALAQLMGLELERVIVAGNGTDPDVVRPGPWPENPAVGLVSGAAPSRGIESVIGAVRAARVTIPELRLLLWLAATGEASREYLGGLRAATAAEPWIEYGQAPYEGIGAELARASVLVVPTPGNAYYDTVAPVKLFDCLAAGRPVVVTPRPEPANIITDTEAGLVASGDDADALAAALMDLLGDEARARRMGENARRAAETRYDWRIIGSRLADEILGRSP